MRISQYKNATGIARTPHAKREFLRAMKEWWTQKRMRATFAWMTDTSKAYPAVVTTEEEGYLVSVLMGASADKNSYVEVMVKPDAALYSTIHDFVSVLNIAGVHTAVEGVGESYNEGVYSILCNQQQYDALIGAVAAK
jgi:hypothetical protein